MSESDVWALMPKKVINKISPEMYFIWLIGGLVFFLFDLVEEYQIWLVV